MSLVHWRAEAMKQVVEYDLDAPLRAAMPRQCCARPDAQCPGVCCEPGCAEICFTCLVHLGSTGGCLCWGCFGPSKLLAAYARRPHGSEELIAQFKKLHRGQKRSRLRDRARREEKERRKKTGKGKDEEGDASRRHQAPLRPGVNLPRSPGGRLRLMTCLCVTRPPAGL